MKDQRITIARIAGDLVRATDRVRMLEGKRNQYTCEREDDSKEPRVLPCWRTILEQPDWCAPCRDRQDVVGELREARASRGAYLRGLAQSVRAWWRDRAEGVRAGEDIKAGERIQLRDGKVWSR